MFDRMREPVSGLTHFFAGVVGVGGTVALVVVGRDDLGKQLSLLVYGVSMVLVFFASAAYHTIQASPRRMRMLRVLDHAAIYLLIAGTYTPVCFNRLTGFWRFGMLAIVWTLALAGIISKVFVVNAPRWFSASIYLLMGWLSVVMVREGLRALPAEALWGLLVGGLFFTAGAVVYMTKALDFRPGVFGFHEVWHIFVILGCLSHYLVILVYVAPLPRVL